MVGREDEAVIVLGKVQRVEMLLVIEVPEHRQGVLPATGADMKWEWPCSRFWGMPYWSWVWW